MDKNIQQMLQEFCVNKPKLVNDINYNTIINASQAPHTLVISCCDSRVDPSKIFNSELGDIFVLRTIANIIPPYQKNNNCIVAATIEFVLKNLTIKNIIILGHSSCAGIACLCDMSNKPTNKVEQWMQPMLNSREIELPRYPQNITNSTDKQSLKTLFKSKENLLKYPLIPEAIKNKNLNIYAWYYDMNTKDIYTLEDDFFSCLTES
jgi:carbonic anhydrase